MAKYARLRLNVDPDTGKRELVIGYEGESGELPMEHESEHRKLAIGVAGKDAVKTATRASRSNTTTQNDDDGGLPQAIEQGQ